MYEVIEKMKGRIVEDVSYNSKILNLTFHDGYMVSIAIDIDDPYEFNYHDLYLHFREVENEKSV